jgi:hypothetical protein
MWRQELACPRPLISGMAPPWDLITFTHADVQGNVQGDR